MSFGKRQSTNTDLAVSAGVIRTPAKPSSDQILITSMEICAHALYIGFDFAGLYRAVEGEAIKKLRGQGVGVCETCLCSNPAA